jgi:hypothetical protein
VEESVGWNNNTSNGAFTYTFNMIDYVNSLLVNCYQNGNVLLLKETHKTSNWLLQLAMVKGSTVDVGEFFVVYHERPKVKCAREK